MKNIILFLFTLSILSCKKEKLPEVIEENPVFYLHSITNQDDLQIYEAGVNGYFMETDYKTTDTSFEMIGIMQDLIAKNGRPYFEFIYSVPREMFETAGDSIFVPGTIGFHKEGQTIEGHRVLFNNLTLNPDPGISYLWDFGDGTTSTEVNPQHLYRFEPGVLKYNVCLQATADSSGCSSSICSEVVFPDYPCKADFSYLRNGLHFSYFALASRGIAPFTYQWKFNNTDVYSFTQRVDYNYVNVPDKGVDQVCLKVTDAAGRDVTYCNNIAVDPSANCVTNFTYQAIPAVQADTNKRFVIVKYHDGKGGIYISDTQEQPSESNFKIVSSEAYKSDRKGNSTQSMRIEFNGVLKRGNEELLLRITDGQIAVAHP